MLAKLTTDTGIKTSETQTKDKSTLGKDDFLKLLMTQIGAQDPLNPMDNEAFVAQLAQFSNLEQLQTANGSLNNLLTAQVANNQTTAASLVGKVASYKSDSVALTSGVATTVNATLSGKAAAVTTTISDSNGKVVRTLRGGPAEKGELQVAWDGRDDGGNPLPTGTYSVKVAASDLTGASVAVESRGKGLIDGVSFENGVPELISGGVRISLSNVTEIHQPPAP
jgi:flagellar basal-body rod modification protein FlgD